MIADKITESRNFPIVMHMHGMNPDDFIGFYRRNKGELESCLEEHGVLKFKGIQIKSLETFQYIVNSISDRFLNYIDGNSPRTKLSSNVYTSTEYHKSQKITMHNELSYSAKWPNKLFFCCLTPAATGGETLIADSREVLQNMDQRIVAEIAARGIKYIRNLHGGSGIGTSWQETFETDSREQVEAYCKAYSIGFEWGENLSLRLEQQSKGIIAHRNTKEKLWFNQIDQFHPYQLGEEIYESMQILYDSPENFPMYVKFGDGKAIDESVVREILQVIEEVTIAPAWQNDELLILDNELTSHGRNPYTGDRRVLVAMSE